MARGSRWFAGALAVMLWFVLGCGGYTIARVEDVQEAPAAPVAAKGGTGKGTKPAPAPSGRAGQIQMTTFAGVQLIVNGIPVAYDLNQGYVVEVPAGTHQVEVVNLLGKQVGAAKVEVPAGKRVRFSYKKKVLVQESTVSAGAMPVAAPAVVAVQAPAAAAAVGSAQIDGLTPLSDRVWVNGREVPFSTAAGSYVVVGMPEGAHELRVERGGMVVYSGALGIRPGENHRCLATLGVDFRWGLNCHFTRPAL